MHGKTVFLKVLVMSAFAGMLTSCIKYHDLVKSEFPQGTKQPDKTAVAHAYRRSATVYDEFRTKAIFDALWLSDTMRTAYVDLYAHKRGLDIEAKEALLKRQLEENRVWLSFYLLADLRDKTSTTLGEKTSIWTPYVLVDGKKKLIPESIKEVEPEPEIQSFFGARFNAFKAVYLVKILVADGMAEAIASGKYESIKLIIGSTYKECCMVWEKGEDTTPKKVLSDDDFYWG